VKKKAFEVMVDQFSSPCPSVARLDTSLFEIAETMLNKQIRHLPVVDEKNRPVGIVSDRDLRILQGLQCDRNTPARDFMTKDPYTAYAGTPLEEVAFEMSQRKIGSAIVSNAEGEIEGIFTSTDGLNALIEVIRGETLT